ALLFLLFDIESLFLFPCMIIFKSVVTGQNSSISPMVLFCELFAFVFILFAGLIYAWRKGVLTWE
ncbi:MAG: NADH-quinone oxidoreductase subunit A, partial [Proteobacteria bacterium]|nr:NADH-quinone oxidoreductase subunit A [Desulfobulbaceae bacterium]MBU4153787.1 NADH-quinone oxidoreductase subunit A [Pseudomonadota bacterium]